MPALQHQATAPALSCQHNCPAAHLTQPCRTFLQQLQPGSLSNCLQYHTAAVTNHRLASVEHLLTYPALLSLPPLPPTSSLPVLQPLGKHNKGTSLIALGRIQLFQDGNRKFSLMPKTDGAKKGSDDAEGPVFTMAIVGGQGEAAGAQGTITLRVSEEGDLKMGFDMTVPKTKEHKQE